MRPRVAKTILKEKNSTDTTQPLSYEASVIKTMWYCKRQIYQWNRVKRPKIDHINTVN